MITLEEFKKVLNDIKEQDDMNEVLTKLLIPDNNGWVSIGYNLVDDIVSLLKYALELNEDDDLIDWWLYDAPQDNKFSYDEIEDDKEHRIKFDLNELDDLYYYATKRFHKVKQEIVERTEEKEYKPIYVDLGDILNE